jgi:hypothetical protein
MGHEKPTPKFLLFVDAHLQGLFGCQTAHQGRVKNVYNFAQLVVVLKPQLSADSAATIIDS